jgi:hypothetical protein
VAGENFSEADASFGGPADVVAWLKDLDGGLSS